MSRDGLLGKTVLLTVGRMASDDGYEGFDEVLEAIPRLLADVPDLACLGVGDGSDRERLRGKAARLGLADRVVFTGRIPQAE